MAKCELDQENVDTKCEWYRNVNWNKISSKLNFNAKTIYLCNFESYFLLLSGMVLLLVLGSIFHKLGQHQTQFSSLGYTRKQFCCFTRDFLSWKNLGQKIWSEIFLVQSSKFWITRTTGSHVAACVPRKSSKG